jgi:hypothetical protein
MSVGPSLSTHSSVDAWRKDKIRAIDAGGSEEERIRRFAAALRRTKTGLESIGSGNDVYREIAETLVRKAARIAENAEWAAAKQVATMLEAVRHSKGRPALRVGPTSADIEHPRTYLDSEMWTQLFEQALSRLQDSSSAVGAVCYKARNNASPSIIVGTAWLIAPNLAVTNRHVLRGRPMDTKLAVRSEAKPQTGLLNGAIRLTLEFGRLARADGHGAVIEVKGVPLLADEDSPLDLAVIELLHPAGAKPLGLSSIAARAKDNVYVLGHPAAVPGMDLDPVVTEVFGNPDGTKRLSLGTIEMRSNNDPLAKSFRHDCSTYGGYSGGPVLCLDQHAVVGLHYLGDAEAGNAANAVSDLLGHRGFSALVPAQNAIGV